MDTIIDPETGKTINLFSQEGLDTLNKFVNTYKKGGNLDDKINNLTNIYTNLQSQFNDIKTYFQKQNGGMKRLFSDIDMSSSSGSDIEINEIEFDKPKISEREMFINSLPDDIQTEIKSDPWTGSSSGIHRKDDTQINLVETNNNFYKFIPKNKVDEIDNIYKTLGNYTMRMAFSTDFYLPLFKLPNKVTIKEAEFYVYRVEKWGESLDNIRRKGLFYHSGVFDDVMIWLKEILMELHSKELIHGDIFKSANEIHWGNILAKQNSYGIWKFKLIDFGNEMSSREKEIEFYKKLFLETNEKFPIKTENYVMLENKIRDDENRNPKYKKLRLQVLRDLKDDEVDYDEYEKELDLENQDPWNYSFSAPPPPIFGSPRTSKTPPPTVFPPTPPFMFGTPPRISRPTTPTSPIFGTPKKNSSPFRVLPRTPPSFSRLTTPILQFPSTPPRHSSS
tara:strand:+ start:40 stop:1386 length:1347 start_codon:yes stop_codon:yes gene_type:complete